MNKLLHTCRAKLTSKEFDGMRDAYHWFLSPRSIVLHVKDNSLVWEGGSILFHDILEASLEKKRTFLIKNCLLLNIRTGSGEYRFQVKPNKFWKQSLPFETGNQ